MKNPISKAAVILLALVSLTATVPAQRTQPAPQITPIKRLPRGMTEAQLKLHVSAPENTKNIKIEETDPSKEITYQTETNNTVFKTTPKLDVAAFAASVHAALKDNVAGYIMQVRQNGNLVYNNIWQWAQTPLDQSKGWNENTTMHIASVSKYLTAVGLVKLLDSKNISYDAKIVDYLPAYWSKGANVNQITFRNLFTHSSGFVVPGSACDYQTMKSYVAAGVSNVGTGSGYENMNYSLMRIMIAVIHGDIDKGAVFSPQTVTNDLLWDALTVNFYREYMQDNVFTPSGISNASFEAPATGNALAYSYPALISKGWNSGNLASVSGAAGWHLTTKQLLDVINTVRRKNTIIPAGKAQYMFDNYFGIDQQFDTPAGKIYNKNGAWVNGNQEEQCVAYFFPNQMEVVVFVNSPLGTQGFSLRNTVKVAFLNNLK